MVTEPLVYSVLVNWNGKGVTLECLRSLGAVTYPHHKIVVVDNASADESVGAIHREFPAVTVLEMSRNLRFAGGTNVGLRYALAQGAEYLLLLNNDTTVDPLFLTALVRRMGADDSIGVVAPKIYYHDDPRRIWFAGGSVSMWTGTVRHIGIRDIDRGQHDAVREIDYASGCCMLVRRSVADAVGLLDERYFMYTEDADWSLRARRAGYKVVFEPEAKIWHKLSVSTGGHLSWYKMSNKFLNNFRFFSRYAAWYHWLLFPWLSVLVNAGAAVRYLVSTRVR